MLQSAEGTSAEGIRTFVRASNDLIVEWRGWVRGRAGYGTFHDWTYFVTVHGGMRWVGMEVGVGGNEMIYGR